MPAITIDNTNLAVELNDTPTSPNNDTIQLPEEIIKGYKDLNEKIEKTITKIHNKRRRGAKKQVAIV